MSFLKNMVIRRINMDNWGTEETPKKDSDIARKIIVAMMILLIMVRLLRVFLLN